MATAIVAGKKGLASSEKISIFDVDHKINKAAEKTGVNICSSNKEIVEECPIIILAINLTVINCFG